jgi:hypothetical protein
VNPSSSSTRLEEGNRAIARTDGNLGTALLDDAGGGRALDLVERTADTRGVLNGAAGGVGNGLVKAGKSARGDIGAGLGGNEASGGSEEDGRVLHFEGWLVG